MITIAAPATKKAREEPTMPPVGRNVVAGMTKAAQPIMQAKEKAQAFSGESLFRAVLPFVYIANLSHTLSPSISLRAFLRCVR